MSVIIYAPDLREDSPSSPVFWRVLEHLRNCWPGTFVIACCTTVPEDTPAGPTWDWVRMPAEGEGWGDERLLTDWMLATVGRLFQVKAWLLVGREASGFLGSVSEDALCLLPGDYDSMSWLDSWLEQRLPVQILAEPGCPIEEILGMVLRRQKKGGVDQVVIRWRGLVDETLQDLLDRLLRESEARVRVEFVSAYLFEVSREGLAHTPLEFLVNPRAWVQAIRLFMLLARVLTRVEFTFVSDSRRHWIRTSVNAANHATRLLRTLLQPGGRP